MTGVRLGLAIAGAALGMLIGLLATAGCGTDDCSCPPPEAIAEGTFDVIAVESPSNNLSLFDVPGSTVTVGADAVAIEYSRGKARVTASYRVLRKYPR